MTRGVAVAIAVAIVVVAFLFLHAPRPGRPYIVALAFSPDGRYLVTAEHRGVVEIRGAMAKRIDLDDDSVNTIAFSPDGQRLAVAGRAIHILNAPEWSDLPQIGGGRSRYFGTARYTPDSRFLATVNAAEQIELWRTSDGLRVRSMCCMALYGDLAFSPDSRLLASTGHWPAIWTVATGARNFRLVETREPTFGPVAFSPDGSQLATGSQDGKVRLWDPSTGRQTANSVPRPSYVESLAFHPGGALIAYRLRDGAVWLWDTASRTERPIGRGATSNLAFRPDGRSLVFAVDSGQLVTAPI
jgi:WD40 repeat protein